jgi:transposase
MNLQMPILEEIHAAFEKGEAAIVELFAHVGLQVQALAKQLEVQAEMLKDIQARLSKDSRNSSKPPSSDGYGKANAEKRTQSLRGSSGKANGGQQGHEGHTLEATDNPDHCEAHKVEQCGECGTELDEVEATGHEERQVFDIPAIRIEVTAHRAEIKTCPICGAENKASFPLGVNSAVQYGSGVKTWAAYFQCQHFVPLERTEQIFEDLVHHRVAEATLLRAGKDLVDGVKPATEAVQEQLRAAEVVHVDESGLRVTGKLHWLHVAATDKLTHYHVHAKRGQEAMDEAGILPDFKGIMTHDHWKTYFKYEHCSHALCNSHHLRELRYLEEQYQQTWAVDMAELLLEIKQTVDETRPHSDRLLSFQCAAFEQRYDIIVDAGYAANPPPTQDEQAAKPKKRGRIKQSPPINLLNRLNTFKPQVLRFMHDFRVPFDNNLAERDIRMIKVKQKVSGGFRTFRGAQDFAAIRGYISTARKNSVNVFNAISDAFSGKPFIPSWASP